MIFDLVEDFADVLDAMSKEHPRQRILKLLDEAIRRDVHFIDRHPTTLFQCLWNSCWWYDCPEAAGHFDLSKRRGTGPLPWETAGRPSSMLLEQWRANKERTEPGFHWLRSLRPPSLNLDSAQVMVIRGKMSVKGVAPSVDGRFLASWGDGIRIWNAESGEELLWIVGHQDVVTSVAWSNDCLKIVSGSEDKSARVWDTKSGQELLRLRGHDNRQVLANPSRPIWCGRSR